MVGESVGRIKWRGTCKNKIEENMRDYKERQKKMSHVLGADLT